MWRHRRLILAATLIIGCACSYVGEAGKSAPLRSTDPTGGAPTVVASLQSTQSPAPTDATPRSSPDSLPTQTAWAPTTTPTAELQSGVWKSPSDFPPAGSVVTSIATYADGFVAVGYVGGGRVCEDPIAGRVWTSADGIAWVEHGVDLRDIPLGDVVTFDGMIRAFAYEGQAGCPSRQNFAVESADGNTWRIRDVRLGNSTYEYATDFASAGNQLLAFGSAYDQQDQFLGSVWTSVDGVDWALNRDSPEGMFNEFSGAVASSNAVVVFDNGGPPIWVSRDGASTWRKATDGVPDQTNLRAAVAGDRFVAVGSACCTTPDQDFGVAITSQDGLRWSESQPVAFRQAPDGVVAFSAGFITIGRQSLLSTDGVTWVVGPDLPGYEGVNQVHPTGVARDTTVVVANRGQAWYANIAELDPSAYADQPRPPELPEIGVSYPASVFTHCGWPPATYFALRAWAPDPPIDDVNPPEGIDELDHGHFTLVGENDLRYESSHGRILTLRPTDEPLFAGPCA